MDVRSKALIGIAVALAAILFVCVAQHRRIQALAGERDRLARNQQTLLTDVETFRVRDSLSGARVQALELSVREFERFRAEDAALIKSLRRRNQDLAAVNSVQSETIYELRAAARDTVIIRDSVPVAAVAVRCGDPWYDFEGVLAGGEFSGTMHNRDSLLVTESVEYRRFLGFLWRTRKVKAREMGVVSRNPHTEILGAEYVFIEK